MKVFIYKTAILAIVFILLFEFLIGARIKKFEKNIYELKSKENIEIYKKKIFKELLNASKKEQYFTEEEREILIKFFNKIKSELNSNQNK